jgi:DNA-binding transcriptional regulator YhcF (GntR family)
MFDDSRAIFVQVAEQIEADILAGTLPEESRAPSTNELAAFHRINPATAAKGIASLVADGILYKRRGIGMFVATGARQALIAKRRAAFQSAFVAPLIQEARKLGIEPEELIVMIKEGTDAP